MSATLVCEEIPLFAEALACCLRSRGSRPVTVIQHPSKALGSLCPATEGTFVLSLRSETGGLEVVQQVRLQRPETRVICLISGTDRAQTAAATDAGADQVVARTAPLEEIVAAVDNLERAVGRLTNRQGRGRPEATADPSYLRFLTTRQREAWALLITARSTEDIAKEMSITTATARGYVQAVLEKLGVHSRLEAVALAGQQRRDNPLEAWCG